MINTSETHTIQAPSARLSLRVKEANPLHHLWNNNGTWWIHYTLHLSDYTAKRVRRSLRTNEATEAIRRRDELLNQISHTQRAA
jgi:hypothetical protein